MGRGGGAEGRTQRARWSLMEPHGAFFHERRKSQPAVLVFWYLVFDFVFVSPPLGLVLFDLVCLVLDLPFGFVCPLI